MRNQRILHIAIAVLALGLISPYLSAFQSGRQNPKETIPLNLDDILKQLATYDGGLNSEAFWKLRDYVRAAKDAPEARLACEEKLLVFLRTNAAITAKTAVCRELRVIGSEKSVPVLEKMLVDKETTDIARYALEKIPAAEADEALLRALTQAKGDIKKGIITSLGQKRSKQAVSALKPLLQSPNPEFAAAAATALGQIGGLDAAEALAKSLGVVSKDLEAAVASALFQSAEEFIASKSPEGARQIYDKMLTENLPLSFRVAAMRGKIAASGDRARTLILGTLAGAAQEMHAPAIGMIKSVFRASDIGPVCAALPQLPEASQVQLLAVLSEYPREFVLPAIFQAAKDSSKDVHIAALKALEKTGDASVVQYLAETAAASPQSEQAVARASLRGLKGEDIDEAILSLLAVRSDEAVQTELVQSIEERRIFAGKSLVAKFADASSAKVRGQAYRAMRAIGTPSDIPGLLEILLKTENEAERLGIENAITGLAQKISDPNGRADAVRAKLDLEKDGQKRGRLLRVLGKIGDESSLSLLREALEDPNAEVVDAAVRSLANWPTPAARDDVREIARTSKNEVLRVLALQAYVRMTGQEKYRSPKAAVRDLKKALKLATRPEEKKLILGVLPSFASPKALKLAATLLGDKDVKEEASVAVNKITEKLKKTT
jgi:HEAT repeat protein